MVLILRVYAIWDLSKRILYTLLFLYVPFVIVSLVLTGIYNNPHTYLSGVPRTLMLLQTHTFLLPSSLDYSSHCFLLLCCLTNQQYSTADSPVRCHPAVYPQYFTLRSCCFSDHKGINRAVQSNKAVATEPVLATACSRWDFLLHYVRSSEYFPKPNYIYLWTSEMFVTTSPI